MSPVAQRLARAADGDETSMPRSDRRELDIRKHPSKELPRQMRAQANAASEVTSSGAFATASRSMMTLCGNTRRRLRCAATQ